MGVDPVLTHRLNILLVRCRSNEGGGKARGVWSSVLVACGCSFIV